MAPVCLKAWGTKVELEEALQDKEAVAMKVLLMLLTEPITCFTILHLAKVVKTYTTKLVLGVVLIRLQVVVE